MCFLLLLFSPFLLLEPFFVMSIPYGNYSTLTAGFPCDICKYDLVQGV